jgi:hypothetical protein
VAFTVCSGGASVAGTLDGIDADGIGRAEAAVGTVLSDEVAPLCDTAVAGRAGRSNENAASADGGVSGPSIETFNSSICAEE